MRRSYYQNEQELESTREDVDNVKFTGGYNAQDALHICKNERLGVDIEYMSRICGMDGSEIIEALEGRAIFLDPFRYERTRDYERSFVTKEQLIRGNVIKKYKKAIRLEKETGLFDYSIRALKEELRDDIDVSDIHANLGATWIPIKLTQDFLVWLFDIRVAPKIEFDAFQGKYSCEFILEPNYIMNHITYGTSRMSAISIIKKILNGGVVRVYDKFARKDSEGTESVVNQRETFLAQEKERNIREKFQEFIHQTLENEKLIQECYMDEYGYSISKFDGAYLDLPDLNPLIKPYKHQKDAIAHILYSKNVLLAHVVGSGKTLEYICAVHELNRIGLCHKALIVVPNNTLEATKNTYLHLYGNDRILCVHPKKEFKPANRNTTMEEIKSDKYQVIIIAYSSFDMITLSQEKKISNIKDEISQCHNAIANTRSYAVRSSLERKRERLNKMLHKALEVQEAETPGNKIVCFDDLGVDVLVIDEAHNYKNITLDDVSESIVGLNRNGSAKANNLLEKVRYVQSIGGRVIFSTGTPITNSLADLYVLQTYLQPDELKELNIDHFNQWINTFCSKEDTYEIDVDSNNYRRTTRFSKFHNLTELMSLFSDACDFYQIEGNELGLPAFNGHTDVVVSKSIEQKRYIDQLSERTSEIRSGNIEPQEDNLLKITIDGRKCAVDYRLVDDDQRFMNRESKVYKCSENMLRIYKEFPDTTQIAFCDISTPKAGFNIYDDLKMNLVKRGIPDGEIAFIHDADTDAKRESIEKRFNEGKIRILIGSTMKLGTGCNVQEKLKAIHHIDVPWRPSDMVQREGRILRQGNTCSEVFIYRYVTEASFDAYSWQIIENKQRFIAQFLSGSLNAVHRDETDCTDTILNYSEIKALAIGNPLIKKRFEVANELESAKIKQRQRRRELKELEERISVIIPRDITQKKRFYMNARNDSAIYKKTKEVISNAERISFGKELLEELSSDKLRRTEVVFDTYQGFRVILPANIDPHKAYIMLRSSDNSNTYEVDMDKVKPIGCSKRIDYLLDHLDKKVDECMTQLQDLNRQRIKSLTDIESGNEYDHEVELLTRKLMSIDKSLEEDIK